MAGFDAIVIGGGVVGMATAWHLVRDGVRTLLLDRADEGRASDAGAGILSARFLPDDPDPLDRLKAAALRYYPVLIERLREDDAGDTGYAVTGALTVAVDEDELAPFAALSRKIEAGGGAHRVIAAAEARALFPPLGEVKGALHSRTDGRVDGRLLVAALGRGAAAHGLVRRSADVARLLVAGGRVQGVVADGEELPAGWVVLAAGAWSGALGAPLGIRIPVAPQRGQICHLHLPEAETGAWPVIGALRDHYLVSWPDGRVAVGATRETGSGFVPQTTVAGIMEVLGEALRVAPGLRAASLVEVRVGLRPASPDGRPMLGPAPGVAGLLLATGHGPSGLLLGPLSGRLIAALVTDGSAGVDLAAFDVARFG
jgi:glycine/D-amino acid oxidase-like deaminating enzyme